ncbi:MAG TPA: histidine kinase, partial [Flavitalea sp.]|nr:histidine kinase [Flavitalea sp.]
EIDRIQKQSELELLRSQLSPHFLFNTLHNLYGLSVTEPSAIPPLLIKLADLLRYSVYETRKEFVLLQDELAYIYNYIDLEKIRLGDRLECVADINMNNYKDVKIAPLILITFIENAFKHAKDSVEEKIYIAISLNINQGEICFTILNSHRDQVTQKKGISEASGQGLPNTIRRLDLLYPNKYSLFQQKELNMYRVELKLKNA